MTHTDDVFAELHGAIDTLEDARRSISRTLGWLEDMRVSYEDTLRNVNATLRAAQRATREMEGKSKTMRARLRTMVEAIYTRVLGAGDGVRTHNGALLVHAHSAISYFNNGKVANKHRMRAFRKFCSLAAELVGGTEAEAARRLQILRTFRAGPHVSPVAPHLAHLPPTREAYADAIRRCFAPDSPEYEAFHAFFPVLVFPEDIVVESFDL